MSLPAADAHVDFSFATDAATLTCRFTGSFKSDNCAAIMATVEHALAPHGGEKLPAGFKVVFDLEKTDYLSSVFIRLVLMTAKRVAAGHFTLANPNPFVRELIRTSGLDQLIMAGSSGIECSAKASAVFPPSAAFTAHARVKTLADYQLLYDASIAQPDAFWAAQAREQLVWSKPWHTVCSWQLPDARWFEGGELNAAVNCLDRHLGTPTADKIALRWVGEPVDEERTLTYRELYRLTCRAAAMLARHGIAAGDRVLIYLPMVPEAVAAMLACARLGAVHTVVFGGFSAQAIAERAHDCGAKVIITADGGYRRGAVVPLKHTVDDALALAGADGRPVGATVTRVIVLKRAGNPVSMDADRDRWWHDEMARSADDVPAVPMPSEAPLFILYTSGSTGKPKGICHSTAGYLLGVKVTHQYIFDLQPDDIYWCTADIGWITGHSYTVYGPLANGATVLLYEGAPNFPDQGRFWQIIAQHKVTILYTAPTAIRTFMQWGDDWPRRHDLSSLRLLGTVGEPINPQAWIWYHEQIGGSRCPIVDTWWQTETGSIMISTFPGAMPGKPGAAGRPLPGVVPEVIDDQGQPVPANHGGKLILKQPWPAMLRGVWGDRERFCWTYWKECEGSYFTGDGARFDADGYLWIVGRIDDVLNISGHRIGTAEVESALVGHPAVAEAAAVGRPDDIKGFGLVAFVTLRTGFTASPALREELRARVGREMGAVARPDEIRFAQALPKTRSGKIMRRLLKQIAAGTEITGDTTTLDDFNVLARLSGDEH